MMRCFSILAVHCLAIALFAAAAGPASGAEDVVEMTVELVSRDDADFRAIGLDRIRHAAKGEAATGKFAALLAKLSAERQIELIGALGDRGDKAAIPAITALLVASQEPAVRAAAVQGLGVLGSGTEVAVLKRSLAAAEPEKSAARRALTILRGDDAVKQIVEAAEFGEPGLRPVFIDILADRRARSALPALVKTTGDADGAVRSAAMRALGSLGGPDQVAGMVAGLLKAAPGGERDQAERAVVAVCTQNTGKEKSADVFLAAFKAAGDADRDALLPALGRIGGPAAMAIVDGLINDPDPAKRQFGLKALTRWPDATVAPRLLDLLAKATDQDKDQGQGERDMLLSALIRIAPLPDNKLNDQQKLELLAKTMQLCQKDEDRARVLERANAIRTVETFRFVLPYLDNPALAEPACKSVVELAHHQKLRDGNKDEFMKALDKVISTTKNAELVERASRYKEGKTWERKKG
ncbi:MAG: HEAT repeat domain-containing protein [Planctomycetia bacterium]|nr:HEAT repeat domain-containing protein [Planctomycetia bacterium]